MPEKLITKSFERLLEKGTIEASLLTGTWEISRQKRRIYRKNTEKAFIIIADNKITLVEKKSQYQSNKKETVSQTEEKGTEKK